VSDGRSFYDTDEVYEAAFTTDWKLAIASPALALYMREAGDDGGAAGAGPEAMAEVAEVMWRHHRLVHQLFDWYAMYWTGQILPATVVRINKGAFKALIQDLGVIKPKSTALNLSAFEQCFLQVTAASAPSYGADEVAPAPTLNRMELLQCLVRIADMTYFRTEKTAASLAHAVELLLTENVSRVVRKDFAFVERPHVYSNVFRRMCCYTRDCSETICENLQTIKGLFSKYCLSEKDGADAELRGSMSFEEYKEFISDFELCDHLFTPRESTLAWVWARLRVIDDGKSKRGKVHLFNLSLECFFEVLVRIAMMKALPTDMELGYAGHDDAGSFFAELGQKPENLKAWRVEHNSYWDVDWEDFDYDPRQPSNRALAHLLEIIVYAVESFSAGGGAGARGVLPKVDACVPEVQLTARKIDKFFLSRGKGRGGVMA